jgi:hypothetical protein
MNLTFCLRFLVYFPFLRTKVGLQDTGTMLSVCVCLLPFQILNQQTNFHTICYEGYTNGAHPNNVPYNFLHPVKATWCMQNLYRWEWH